MAKTLMEVFHNRKKIFEGIKNSIFTKDTVEKIAHERALVCRDCPEKDIKGDKCFVPGTAPCCGVCGCKLAWKLRALSEECPHPNGPKWPAILTPEEEGEVNKKLGINDEL
jgi:hypothetical protein